MKTLKYISYILSMLVISILGVLTIWGISVKINLNSSNLLSAVNKTAYVSKTKDEVFNMLKAYLPEGVHDTVLEKINIEQDISKAVHAFDSNNIKTVTSEIKETAYNNIVKILKETEVEDKNLLYMANMISDKYVKLLIPINELSYVSEFMQKYSSKVSFVLVIFALLIALAFVYCYTSKKGNRWAIVALYNVIVISVLIYSFCLFNDDISIGGERAYLIISKLIGRIEITSVIFTIIVLAVSIILNYILYFKRKVASKSR